MSQDQKRTSDSALGIASVRAIQGVTETSIREASGIIREMFRASKSSPLMAILSFIFGLDFYQKLGLIWPNTAQAGREALWTAIKLSFDFSKLQNLKLWEQDIPIIGFGFTSTATEYESILKTSMTVDATGGESIVERAITELGSSGGGGEHTTESDIATVRRLRTLTALLEKLPEVSG